MVALHVQGLLSTLGWGMFIIVFGQAAWNIYCMSTFASSVSFDVDYARLQIPLVVPACTSDCWF
jgi:hypothetical protein